MTNLHTITSETDCADRLKVLADRTRLEIVRILLESGPRHVNQINAELDIEQSLLSHHLRVLRDAGLVHAERDGKAVSYTLAAAVKQSRGHAINLGCCSITFD